MKLFITLFLFSAITINAQWVKVLDLPTNVVKSIAVDGATVMVGTDTSGIYRSIDNGATWKQLKIGTTKKNYSGLFVKDNLVLAGAYDTKIVKNGLYRSTDKGETWTQITNNQFGASDFKSFTKAGQAIYAGAATAYGVFKSTDDGLTWTQKGMVGANINQLNSNEQNVFICLNQISGGGLGLTTDGGELWDQIFNFQSNGGAPSGINASIVHNGYIYCDGDAFYKRQASNATATFSKLNNNLISSYGGAVGFASKEKALFVAIKGGVYHTTNDGASFWSWANGLPTSYSVNSFSANTDNAFIGLFKNGVWRRSLSQITAVEKSSEEIPSTFELNQNYPNPFNPETTISYSIKKSSRVSLKVYDVLGNVVATLVDEYQQAGTYTSSFNTLRSTLSSGVYFYTLKAGEFSSTKKMILLK